MNTWRVTRTAAVGGRFLVLMSQPGGALADVTFFRGAPVKITYSSGDPFGDSVATLGFSQASVFDDRYAADVAPVLADDAAVDIWWVPAMPVPADWPPGSVGSTSDLALWQNPLTGVADQLAPSWNYTVVTHSGTKSLARGAKRRGTKVWEGFVTSQEVSSSPTGDELNLQCQGALYQADCYLAKPQYPTRPQTLESLIDMVFNRTLRPHLRTGAFRINWPANWSLKAPPYDKDLDNSFLPNVAPGTLWTGYTSRQTGSWDHALTSYVAQMLAVMLVKPGSGTTPGYQWTVRHAHEGDPLYPAGRTPYLSVRDKQRPFDFAVWAGIPGVQFNLTRDATQRADVIYGTGTDLAGTTWSNQLIATNGTRTDYKPLAASALVYPVVGNYQLTPSRITREQYVQYGSGFSEVDGIAAAGQALGREMDAGWSGSVTLSVDPSASLSRWTITAGMSMGLLGFRGTGADGLRLHVSQVQADVEAGTVELTVDTRYRDLLTLSEALNRTRDALTPAKLLSLNKNSVTIEDIQMRWSDAKGSGYVPGDAHLGAKHRPVSQGFPYRAWAAKWPPKLKPSWYVMCKANDTKQPGHKGRWSVPVLVRMSEKGTIRRSEFACYNQHGQLLAVPFHVSLYYVGGATNNDVSIMPHTPAGNFDPLTMVGAFEQTDPSTGEVWTDPFHYDSVAPIFAMGWGNREQPAGYSPGLKTQGGHPTGMLVDESAWTFDCSANNTNYNKLAKAGDQAVRNISLQVFFYCDYSEPVYFTGRLFVQNAGTG